MCVYCCLVTFISVCVTRGTKRPPLLQCGTTTFKKISGCVCVCVRVRMSVFKKRNGLLYHCHPDTAGIESERQWRVAKETNRLS